MKKKKKKKKDFLWPIPIANDNISEIKVILWWMQVMRLLLSLSPFVVGGPVTRGSG